VQKNDIEGGSQAQGNEKEQKNGKKQMANNNKKIVIFYSFFWSSFPRQCFAIPFCRHQAMKKSCGKRLS
jgi:hypothetical protein